MRFAPFVWSLALLVGHSCAASAAEPQKIDFNRDVRTLLSNNCFHCHGPDPEDRQGGGEAGLRLDTRDGAIEDLGGYAAIVPGEPDESEFIRRLESEDEEERMPPAASGKKLSQQEIALFREWVKQGAPYAKHWAYVPPVRPEVPQTQSNWAKNPIDQFLLERLEREGLKPAPEADRYALARRVALDLTGLPPAWEEVERYVNDAAPDAYEQFVDRLLAKPSYGEHWARLWLDLARYADSAGYANDLPRTIWGYRDYVIRAFNDNKPFDQFTIEQLAGDLLPNPTPEQLVATAFHRNTLTNNEGGTNDEEFRNVAIVDRVNTTFAVWMGTTMACAQCHTHKYDPITQEEYFSVFAIFNNSADADRQDESPLIEIFTDQQRRQRAAWQAEIAALEKSRQGPTPEVVSAQAAGEQKVHGDSQRERLAKLKTDLSNLKPITTVPILRELPRPRKTFIQLRGNWLAHGDEVTPGVPAAFGPLPEKVKADRLALARWLVDEKNPLAARVLVNRYWETIFGTGLVASSEEFGSQGDLPSHPELLDWLATEMVAHDWNLKYFVRLLVTSAAYRQSSQVTPEQFERDPENRLLARGPRFRLSAEMIRDQALAACGLLNSKLYGEPVKPYQPALGLKAAFGEVTDWKMSTGEDRYRRGIYTSWRRSNPYASMATFDAPNREVCTLKRSRTNTPLQALATLNDPVYIEAAQALARRTVAAAAEPNARARYAFIQTLGRPPREEELAPLVALYEESRSEFAAEPNLAVPMATVPLGPAPPGHDVVELAAWTVVGNVLLNLDELFMRK